MTQQSQSCSTEPCAKDVGTQTGGRHSSPPPVVFLCPMTSNPIPFSIAPEALFLTLVCDWLLRLHQRHGAGDRGGLPGWEGGALPPYLLTSERQQQLHCSVHSG